MSGAAAKTSAATATTGPTTRLVGSVRYLSVAAHSGGRQTRRCDLESLAYVLIYLVRVSCDGGLVCVRAENTFCIMSRSLLGSVPKLLPFVVFFILVWFGVFVHCYGCLRLQGKLPWQGLTAKTREAHMEKIRKSKTEEVRKTHAVHIYI